MKEIFKYQILVLIVFVMMISSCQQPGGDSPGSEYMPDMAHSIAYEANYYNYYYNNTWGTEDAYYKLAQPRYPVDGTVARTSSTSISMAGIGGKAYAYGDTEEERTRATNEIINNPHKITDAGLAVGKELYNINCAICHGAKGDGNGYLVRDGSPYPVQPAIFTTDEFIAASNGRYYHSIMHGKNLMGSYADKLSEEERWQVIHWIRALQAKEKKLAYNQFENTLNSIEIPAGEIAQVAEMMEDSHPGEHSDHEGAHDHDDHHGEHHGETNHSNDHHDGSHGHDHDHGDKHHDHDHDHGNHDHKH